MKIMDMQIKVPTFADSSAYAVVVSYFVEEGSNVEEGQDLLEIETDKALLKIGSPIKGIISAIHNKEGSTVQPNEVLLEIQEST